MSDALPAVLAENPFTKARQALLAELEGLLATKLRIESLSLATYVANTMNPAAIQTSPMNPSHGKPLYDVLRDGRSRSANLGLILNTMGGDAQFPARLVRLIREDLAFQRFFVVVPEFAKSAGTVVALASDAAVSGPTTQFGAIDPQLPRISPAGQSWVSARAVRDAYKKLREETIPNLPSGAQVGVASGMDFLLHQQALDALQLTTELVRQIQSNYHKELNVNKILQELIETSLAHGKDVSPAQLAGYGFPVIQLALDDPLWSKLSEYYTRALRSLQLEQAPGAMGVVLFESRQVSMAMNAQVAGMGKSNP